MQALGGAVGIAATQQGAAVAGTFQKIDPAFHLILQQVFIAEDQRLRDQTIDDQGMTGRIDGGHAGVVAFEMQAVRRDCALQELQRGA